MQLLHDLIFDYTLRNVALGAAIIGIVNGALGAEFMSTLKQMIEEEIAV